MQKLREKVDELLEQFDEHSEIKKFCSNKVHALPFNYYECVLSHLLVAKLISLDDYKTILSEYDERNPYLPLFEKFGVALENWVLKELCKNHPILQSPKIHLDPAYEKRKYDLFLPIQIRIEVKTSRAVKYKSPKPLYEKALPYNSTESFDMNFQQLKPDFCDVFLFAIIWRDKIEYLVLSSTELRSEDDYSKKQHAGRGENIEEGQLHIKRKNIELFRQNYLSPLDKIEENIRKAFERNKKSRS